MLQLPRPEGAVVAEAVRADQGGEVALPGRGQHQRHLLRQCNKLRTREYLQYLKYLEYLHRFKLLLSRGDSKFWNTGTLSTK